MLRWYRGSPILWHLHLQVDKNMNTYDKATTSSKESKSMSSTWVQQVQIYENREPINNFVFCRLFNDCLLYTSDAADE